MVKKINIDAWHDEYGRQYFWNYLLKSSLFSEFFFNTALQKTIATIMSLLSLSIFFYIGLGLFVMKKNQIKEATVFLLLLIFSIGTLLLYRIKISVACNTDFRYILPILISIAYFYAIALEWSKKQEYIVVEWFGYMQILLFTLLSFIFFLL